MKIKLLLSLVVCVCSFIFAFTNMNNVNCSNVLSLVNVESLANDETDDGIDDGIPCWEDTRLVKIENQECSIYDRTFENVYREIYFTECKGAKGSGSCHKGYVYEYYDCDGYYIGCSDKTKVTECKGEE